MQGNSYADKFASVAADRVRVPLQVATDVVHYYNLVRRIQLRFVAILQQLPQRIKHKTVSNPKSDKVMLQQKLDESRHVLAREGDRFTCTRCLDSFTIKDPAFQHWLAGVCIQAPTLSSRPVPLSSLLHIGNSSVHSSHKLQMFKGLVYCNRCGSRATHHLRRLAFPCRPPGKHGRMTLKCIREGRLPPAYAD